MNTNIGHQHPKVVKAIQDQAAKLCFVHPGNATEPRGLLGKKLAEVTPGNLKKTFFTLGVRMASYPFSGWKESFFGDLHGQGMDAVEFFTQKKVVVERWPKEWSRKF
jgi:hypothetical protein